MRAIASTFRFLTHTKVACWNRLFLLCICFSLVMIFGIWQLIARNRGQFAEQSHTYPPAILPIQPTAPSSNRYSYHEDFASTQSRAQTLSNSQNIDWNTETGQLTLAKRHNRTQQDPLVVTDGNAHIYVVWQDLRRDDGDIYAQRVDANGNPLWPVNQRVNKDDGDTLQTTPTAGVDGAGNLVVAWTDRRNGNERIYAQLLNSEGVWLWAEDIAVSASGAADVQHAQGAPAVTIDENEQLIIVWHDNRLGDYDIFAQKLNRDGLRQWESDRRVNSDQSLQSQVEPSIASSGGSNVVVIWLDQRVGNRDIYAQQLGTDGSLLLGTEVQINPTDSGAGTRPTLAVLADGTSFVAWHSPPNGYIAIQKLLGNGQLGWTSPRTIGPRTAALDGETAPGLVVNSATITLVWKGIPLGETFGQLYLHQFDGSGSIQWQASLIESFTTGTFAHLKQITPAQLADGQLLVTWPWIQQNGQNSVVLQAMTADGAIEWPVPHWMNDTLGSVDQRVPAIATTSSDDTVVVWRDQRADQPALFIQRLDKQGNLNWRESISIHRRTLSSNDQLVPAVDISTEDAYVTWSDRRTSQPNIYLQRIDAMGNRLWNDARPVSRAAEAGNSQINPAIQVGGQVGGQTGSDGPIVVAWEEIRGQQRVIVAQQVNRDGWPQWPADVVVSEQNGSARLPALAVDDAGNSTIIWSVTAEIGTDLWALRLDSSGNRLWSQPVQVNQYPGLVDRFNPPAIAREAGGTTSIVWVDRRERAIYAQRLDSGGKRLWVDDLLVSTTATGGSPSPAITALSTGELMTAWQSVDGVGEQIIVTQTIDGAGRLPGVLLHQTATTARHPVSEQIRNGSYPQLAMQPDGDVMVAWQDERAMNPDVYLQRLDPQGTPLWDGERMVVSRDHFYMTAGTLQSSVTDTTAFSITHAVLNAVVEEAGGTVIFQLSNDDGRHWADVQLGVMHLFTTTGSALRWQSKLTVDPILRSRTPAIDELTITYAAALLPTNDLYEPDDTCREGYPLRIDGAPQAHQLYSQAVLDRDWFTIDVAAGQSYTLFVEPERYTAELSVAIYSNCNTDVVQREQLLQGGVHQVTFTSATDTTYYVLVTYSHATPTLQPLRYAITFHQQSAPGLAIIVAGPLLDQSRQNLVTEAAGQAYRTLLQHGYTADTINYLDTAPEQGSAQGVDAPPTYANLQNAFQSWAPLRELSVDKRLLLYLVGEFSNEEFHLPDDERLSTSILDRWLSNLEATSAVSVIGIVGEGSAAGALMNVTGSNRIVATSSSATAVAWAAKDRLLFSESFWAAFNQGYSLQRSFQLAQTHVAYNGCALPATQSCQMPGLDDTGDGSPNATLDTPLNGRRAWRWQLGALSQSIPQIVTVRTQTDENAGTLTVTAQVLHHTQVGTLQAHLIQPTQVPTATTPVAFPALELQSITLTADINAGSDINAVGPHGSIVNYSGTFPAVPTTAGTLMINGIDQATVPILPYTERYYGGYSIFLPIVRK